MSAASVSSTPSASPALLSASTLADDDVYMADPAWASKVDSCFGSGAGQPRA